MSFVKSSFPMKAEEENVKQRIHYKIMAMYRMFLANSHAILVDKIDDAPCDLLSFMATYACDSSIKELCYKTMRDDASLEIRRTRSFVVKEIMALCDLFTFADIYIKTTANMLKCRLK